MNYKSDWVETQHISQEGSVVDKKLQHVMMTSSFDKSRDIKGALLKAQYLLEKVLDWV